jgi:hypothetical protein
VQGDLVDDLPALAADAPVDATLVIFHSAVLPYVPLERQRAFVDVLRSIAAARPVVWIANEGPGVVGAILGEGELPPPSEPTFLLTRNEFRAGKVNARPLARAHPHGAWISWLQTYRRR